MIAVYVIGVFMFFVALYGYLYLCDTVLKMKPVYVMALLATFSGVVILLAPNLAPFFTGVLGAAILLTLLAAVGAFP